MHPTSRLVRCLAFLLHQVAPKHCPGCDRELPGSTPFCEACTHELGSPVVVPTGSIPGSNAVWAVRALGHFRPPLSTAIQRLKYQRRADLVGPLAQAWLDAQPGARVVVADYLVPVPLHPRRLVDRGFNQSALVARALARGVGMPWAPRLLSKVVETPNQASLGRDERHVNLRNAFLADPRSARPGARLILVDDVVTTGETVRACADALDARQMQVVEVWALAHASRESPP